MMRTLTKLTVKNVDFKNVCYLRNKNDEDFDKINSKKCGNQNFHCERLASTKIIMI